MRILVVGSCISSFHCTVFIGQMSSVDLQPRFTSLFHYFLLLALVIQFLSTLERLIFSSYFFLLPRQKNCCEKMKNAHVFKSQGQITYCEMS